MDSLELCLKHLIFNFTHCSLFNAEKFRFSAEFIELRRQALDIFVNRIASHHELQQSEDLRTFLQADEEVSYLNFCIGKFGSAFF